MIISWIWKVEKRTTKLSLPIFWSSLTSRSGGTVSFPVLSGLTSRRTMNRWYKPSWHISTVATSNQHKSDQKVCRMSESRLPCLIGIIVAKSVAPKHQNRTWSSSWSSRLLPARKRRKRERLPGSRISSITGIYTIVPHTIANQHITEFIDQANPIKHSPNPTLPVAKTEIEPNKDEDFCTSPLLWSSKSICCQDLDMRTNCFIVYKTYYDTNNC